jgi:MerR family transcriptional regulator, copper efflux regulator
MKIGELAKACGVSASKIRYFEEEGLLPPALRNSNGYRHYAASSVEAIAQVLQAQRLGFSIAEIRAATPAGGLDALDCDQILALLKTKQQAIARQLRELNELAVAVDASVAEFKRRKKLRK